MKTYVYIAKGHWDHEGFEIIGVYATQALAAADIAKHKYTHEERGCGQYDRVTVEALPIKTEK